MNPIRPLAPLGALFAALATAATAAPPLDQRTDVIPSSTPQEVQLVEHDFAPGETSGWHIHHGVELAYVMKGDLELKVAGRPPIQLHPGDSFQVPRDTPHEATNTGSSEAALIISYLIDKGGPAKIAVPAPVGAH
jgi:quercetin dioxygenase-like cupin family protein